MNDVRWYNDEPKTGQQLDVSTWHPYSTPAIERKGQWGFSASPTDLWNIGKYLWKGLKGLGGGASEVGTASAPAELKDLFGGSTWLGAPAITAGATPGLGAGVVGSGALDLGSSALPSAAGAIGTGAGAGVTGAATVAPAMSAAEAAYAAGAGPAALSPLFGGGSLPAAAASSTALPSLSALTPGLIVPALALMGFSGMLGGKKKPYAERWADALEGYRQQSLKDILEYLGSGKGIFPTSAGFAGLSNVLRPEGSTGPLTNWEDLYNAAKQYALAQHGHAGFGPGQFKPRTNDLLDAIDHEIGLVQQGVLSPEYLKPLQDLRRTTAASLEYGTGIFGSNMGVPQIRTINNEGGDFAEHLGTSNEYAPFWGYKPVEQPEGTNWLYPSNHLGTSLKDLLAVQQGGLP